MTLFPACHAGSLNIQITVRAARVSWLCVSERFCVALSEVESEPEAVTVGSVKGKVRVRHEERSARTCALPFTETRDMSSRGKAQANTELRSGAP